MSEALTIFKAVNDESMIEKLLQKAAQSKESIVLKDKFDRSITLKTVSTQERTLHCEWTEETPMNLQGTEKFLGSFILGSDKYIFETRPVLKDGQVILNFINLFHLQKRRNYRYVIPENYDAAFDINFVNETATQLHCKLLDLSTEGCAIEISQEQMSVNLEDQVEAYVILGHRPPILAQGFVKNIRLKGDFHMVLGIKFNHMARASEEKIISSITDLQRELYFLKSA